MIKKAQSNMRFVEHNVLTEESINKHYDEIIAKSLDDLDDDISDDEQDVISDFFDEIDEFFKRGFGCE
jgi:hypothetical protein